MYYTWVWRGLICFTSACWIQRLLFSLAWFACAERGSRIAHPGILALFSDRTPILLWTRYLSIMLLYLHSTQGHLSQLHSGQLRCYTSFPKTHNHHLFELPTNHPQPLEHPHQRSSLLSHEAGPCKHSHRLLSSLGVCLHLTEHTSGAVSQPPSLLNIGPLLPCFAKG